MVHLPLGTDWEGDEGTGSHLPFLLSHLVFQQIGCLRGVGDTVALAADGSQQPLSRYCPGDWVVSQDPWRGSFARLLCHPANPFSLSLFPHSSPKDTLGGGFDATQAFVGELAHFNIWDRKLTPGEVYNLATCSSKALSGNVIAWAESQIEIFGGATKWTFEACRQIN